MKVSSVDIGIILTGERARGTPPSGAEASTVYSAISQQHIKTQHHGQLNGRGNGSALRADQPG
jgi:hypothetical protein